MVFLWYHVYPKKAMWSAQQNKLNLYRIIAAVWEKRIKKNLNNSGVKM